MRSIECCVFVFVLPSGVIKNNDFDVAVERNQTVDCMTIVLRTGPVIN